MTQLFANNAQSTLASSVNSSVTTLSLATGTGALFPSPSGGDFFMLTLTQPGIESSWEIVKVTARSTDSLTVVRAQEGTSAASWASGSKAELRLTAGAKWSLANIDESIAPTWTGAHRFNQAVGIGSGNSSSTGSMLVVAGAQFNSLLVRSTGSSGGVGSSDIYLGSASSDSSGGILGYDHTTNTLGLGAGGAVKVSINSSGNVGIGVTPVGRLDVGSGTNARFKLGLSATEVQLSGRNSSDTGSAVIGLYGSALTFSSDAGEIFRTDANRRLLIGSSATTSAKVRIVAGTDSWMRLESGSAAASYMEMLQGGSTSALGYIGSDGGGAVSGGAGSILAVRGESGIKLAVGNSVKVEVGASTVKLQADNRELQIGASGDLRIYHDGTDSYIENDTGNLVLKVNGDLALSEVSTTTTAPSAGGAGALPATPDGYVTFIVNGTAKKFPFYPT